jgi:hypothetical protein
MITARNKKKIYIYFITLAAVASLLGAAWWAWCDLALKEVIGNFIFRSCVFNVMG